MDKTFDPKAIESETYAHWEKQGYFQAHGEGEAYSIVIPPPNVTGTLHMGHGFQDTIMDTLTRYHRMRGFKTLWQPGSDHAGIATQMVVERQLAADGLSRHDLGRDKFTEKVWEWKTQSGDRIEQQIRRLGASLDWTRERFTLDEGLSEVVQNAFIKLYDEGLIYRGERLVNWDPKLHTAISDLEVVNEEEKGHMWHINYPLADGSGVLGIATTRPETMLGDTAVAVHPDDERYKSLVGKMILLPLANREIPIIADDYVDPEFGTGCVKITPAHDFNDYDMGKRHDLPMISILNEDASLNDLVPEAYRGLDRFVARKKIVADLEALGLLEKVEPHTLSIPRGDRTGVVAEPRLTKQWYVNVKPLAGPAIDAVKSGEVRFVPGNWDKTYFQWMENIQDWCISRQLWWGHRVPAWYDDQGKVYVGESEDAVRVKHALADDVVLTQDNDVLDTWFSSAFWPFATLGWPDDEATFKQFYPTSVLVTGFDIIFFWVARMIMFGLKFTGKVPFREVYVTGLIRDHEGKKMSKSKGNVLDPIDLIDGISIDELVKKRTFGLMQPKKAPQVEKNTRKEFPEGLDGHGTDALRFTFCALANNSRDIRFDVSRLEGYRNFCNKLWNASRFVLMNLEQHDIDLEGPIEYSIADRWILSRLQKTIKAAHAAIAKYRFDFLCQGLYEFVWYEYCDWYLELTKPVLNDPEASDALKRGALKTLIDVLDQSLRLLHPVIPFITETIWQNLKPMLSTVPDSLMLAAYPEFDQARVDESAEADVEWMKKMIIAVRTIRGEMNISPAKALPVILSEGSASDKIRVKDYTDFLSVLAKLESLNWQDGELPASATQIIGDLSINVPMAGIIDTTAELARLEKEHNRVEGEIKRLKGKLQNERFVSNAPADVVDKEKAKLKDYDSLFEKLASQLKVIQSL
jgi:valyl-tRNA synthetase